MSRIRILLAGLPLMLNEIVRAAIAGEPDMAVIGGGRCPGELGLYTKRNRIDVVIFVFGDETFADDRIDHILRDNPRLSLLGMDRKRDSSVLHHLVPAHDQFDGLAQPSLAAAIRAGAALKAL